MSNLIDYIKWRGDLSLEEFKFNEVDNLALTRLSYFPLESLMKEEEEISIKELAERFKKKNINEMKILWPDDKDLIVLMGESERFGKIKITKFIHIFDKGAEEQFAAITAFLPDNIIYVSYRGTDCSIVGWKEDFNLSFKSDIGSQISAKKYLNEIGKKYSTAKIIVGGHSKGGNVAVYAAIYANKEVKDRIIKVYNIDGPGFEKRIVESNEYKEIVDKIISYIPQESIIGRLMNHKERITIIQSTANGIMQHDLYSWQVMRNNIIRVEELTNGSEFIDKTITGWLEEVEPAKREIVIDAIFKIIYATEVETFKGLKTNKIENAKTILTTYNSLDSETKEMIMKTIRELLKIARSNMGELFG